MWSSFTVHLALKTKDLAVEKAALVSIRALARCVPTCECLPTLPSVESSLNKLSNQLEPEKDKCSLVSMAPKN